MEVAIIISFMSMLAVFITIFLSFKAIDELATDFLETNNLLVTKTQNLVFDTVNLRKSCDELRMQKIEDEERITHFARAIKAIEDTCENKYDSAKDLQGEIKSILDKTAKSI